MRNYTWLLIALVAFASCTNPKQEEQIKTLQIKRTSDSVLLAQLHNKDTTISSFLGEFSAIQDTLDKIKDREKIITGPTEMKNGKESIMQEIKMLDDIIIRNDKKINRLAAKLKSANIKNDTLDNIIKHLYAEIAEKDDEITDLQNKLGKANDSIKKLSSQFNDSISFIKKQRAQVFQMKTQLSTVYYLAGTMKQLQDKGVVDKQGGIIGIGSVAQLNSNLNNNLFTKTDLNSLHGIALNGKIRRLATIHPDNCYMVHTNGTTDSLIIYNQSLFWSESKYLVIITK